MPAPKLRKGAAADTVTANGAPTRRRGRYAVALLIESSNAYARGLLAGITAFIQRHEPWSVSLPEMHRGALPRGWLQRWHGDGIIARIENDAIARQVMQAGVPVVDVSAARAVPSIPWVETDDAAIAQLVFDHFIERGYRNFAFCGDGRFNWSRWRQEAFARLAEARGHACAVFDVATLARASHSHREPRAALVAWLRSLPKPAGVMAAYDIQAQQLLDACREARLAVPEDLAVVGVDNDEVLCNLCSPPLSSVVPDAFHTGLKAAELLQRMMTGQPVEPVGHFLAPVRLVVRESSAGLAISDPHVAAAMRMIREHACDGIDVQDIVHAARISRRALESRFRKLVGRSPHEELLRVKVERIKQLLEESDLTLSAIARRTGFAHDEYLTVVFKRLEGISPSAYRNRQRGQPR